MIGVVPASLVLAVLAGYGLATLRVPFANAIFVVFVLGLTIPFESSSRRSTTRCRGSVSSTPGGR